MSNIAVTKDTYYFIIVGHMNPTSAFFYQLYVTAALYL